MCEILARSHMTYAIIDERNLREDDLSSYPLLILPNAVCLDDEAAKKVSDYVKNGGNVIATLCTGMCDENGIARKESVFASLFGIESYQIEQFAAGCGYLAVHDDALSSSLLSAPTAGFAGPVLRANFSKEDVYKRQRLLMALGLKEVILCDRKGAIYEGRDGLNSAKAEMAKITNREKKAGSLAEMLVGADVAFGLSGPGIITQDMVKTMNKDPMLFVMSNPTPEIMPDEAKAAGAAVIGTGRSDFPNQINNLLAFPGVFRGALDVRASDINDEMKVCLLYTSIKTALRGSNLTWGNGNLAAAAGNRHALTDRERRGTCLLYTSSWLLLN